MGPMQEIGMLVIQTLGSMYLFIVLLRFMLQLARADFYNPISQFAIKATNPVLIPIRRVVPGVFGIDLASIALALIVHYAVIQLSALVLGAGLINPINVLIWALVGLLALAANLLFWGLLIMVVCSWVAPQSHHPALMLLRQLVEPVMAPIRKIIPDMGGMDISPIFAFLALNVVQILIKALAQQVGMGGAVSQLVIGL